MHALIVTRKNAYNSLTFQLKFALKFALRSNVTIPHSLELLALAFNFAPFRRLSGDINNVEIAKRNVMVASMVNVYVKTKLTRLKKLGIFADFYTFNQD